ncbi:MAG: alpha/beta fold hydrolase [Burkholderiales bacterium]
MNLVHVPPSPRLAVEHAGAGPLVVFLHGIGGNRRNFQRQLEAVAGGGFHAAAWDARGYGDSEDYEGELDFGEFSRDLIRVLDYFSAEAAHVVGVSMGGLIAQDFYRRHPRRVRSLVLAGTRNGYARTNAAEFLKRREAPLLAGLAPRDIAADLASTLASRSAPDAVLAQLRESIAALHKESYLKALRTTTRIGELPGYSERSSYVDLKSVAVPTLVVCGTEDGVTPPGLSRELAAGIPGAKLQMIESAGHLCNIEQPEAFNAALVPFLQSVR